MSVERRIITTTRKVAIQMLNMDHNLGVDMSLDAEEDLGVRARDAVA